jgi:hypothetical protein
MQFFRHSDSVSAFFEILDWNGAAEKVVKEPAKEVLSSESATLEAVLWEFASRLIIAHRMAEHRNRLPIRAGETPAPQNGG